MFPEYSEGIQDQINWINWNCNYFTQPKTLFWESSMTIAVLNHGEVLDLAFEWWRQLRAKKDFLLISLQCSICRLWLWGQNIIKLPKYNCTLGSSLAHVRLLFATWKPNKTICLVAFFHDTVLLFSITTGVPATRCVFIDVALVLRR